MKHVRLSLALLVLPLTGCNWIGDAQDVKAKETRSVSEGLPAGVKPDPLILKTRRVAGVWKSSPGLFADIPESSVEISLANDGGYQLFLKGKNKRGSVVLARHEGRYGTIKDGFAGSAIDPKSSPLNSLKSWTLSMPKRGQAVLSSISDEDQKIVVTYLGR